MTTTADVVLWGGLAVLLLVAVLRAVRSVRVMARFIRSAAIGAHRGELLAPLAIAVGAGVAMLAAPLASSAQTVGPWLDVPLFVALGLGSTWLVASLLSIGVRTLLARYDIGVADNLIARRVHTQYRVLLRISLIVVWVLGGALMLSTIPDVRTLGNGLLASAGIVGLVLGLAAQRTIGNFLAGIQIALTQPIRLDDAVVIEAEWGWIEDITTTYVVVKLWDERRLIVPFSKLLEQPFQNWTRTRADIIGSVMIWVDYGVQVAALRQELTRVVQETELWDGRVAVLQVVECSERAIQLRALVSASSSPRAWDLRCHVREKLVAFVACEQPGSLPTVRASVESAQRGRDNVQPELPIADPAMIEPDVGGLPGAPESQVVAEAEPLRAS